MKITIFEGGDRLYGEPLSIAVDGMLRSVRQYLTAMSKLGLAVSEINYARVLLYPDCDGPHLPPDLDTSNLNKPLLLEFERDLISLQLHSPVYDDECAPGLEVVWKTGASMHRFRALVDLAYQSTLEYSQPAVHRALDQAN
jgi:hypothetical protein